MTHVQRGNVHIGTSLADVWVSSLSYCGPRVDPRSFEFDQNETVAGGFGADLGPKSIQAISFLRKSYFFWSFLIFFVWKPGLSTDMHLSSHGGRSFCLLSLCQCQTMVDHGFLFLLRRWLWQKNSCGSPLHLPNNLNQMRSLGPQWPLKLRWQASWTLCVSRCSQGVLWEFHLPNHFFLRYFDPGVHLGISWSIMMESDWDIESLDLQLDGEQYIVSGQWIWRWMAGLTRFKNPLSDERNLGFFSSSGCDMVRFIYLPGFGKARAEAWQRQFFHGVKTWAVPNYKSIATNICSTKNHKIIKNPCIWFNFGYWDAIDFFYFIWISFGCDAPSESGQIPQGPAMRVASQSSGNEPWSLVD